MRATNILLLVLMAIFFGHSSALTTAMSSNPIITSPKSVVSQTTAQNLADEDKRFLIKAAQNNENEGEGRAFGLSSLKKLIPGTKAFKAATAAREAQMLKAANMFKVADIDEKQLFLKYREWLTAGNSGVDMLEGLKNAGISLAKTQAIVAQYQWFVRTLM